MSVDKKTEGKLMNLAAIWDYSIPFQSHYKKGKPRHANIYHPLNQAKQTKKTYPHHLHSLFALLLVMLFKNQSPRGSDHNPGRRRGVPLRHGDLFHLRPPLHLVT